MNKLSLPASSWLTIAALVSMAAVELIGVLLLEGEHPPVALVIELLLLALAALVVTGRWWATARAAGLSGLFLLFSLAGSMSTLSQPHTPELTSPCCFWLWPWSP